MIRILGVDPGSLATGYGIIDMDGNHARHVTHGVIKLPSDNLSLKLKTLFETLSEIAREHVPDEVSVERVFMHRNADSALKLGQARGAAITACVLQELPVFEYSATQVKQATVGKGNAAKKQVQHMVRVLLCLGETPATDASDALAIALCHGHSREGIQRMGVKIRGIRKGRLR